MKNQNHSLTRSQLARHSGRNGNDTNPATPFDVLLALLKRTRIGVIVKAASLADAREQAAQLARIVEQCSPDYDEVRVEHVRPKAMRKGTFVAEGIDHD
jgi:hypothetical protein